MIVDLLHPDSSVAQLFDSGKEEVLLEYNRMIDSLQKKSSDLTWLLNNVTSRNTQFSKLFYYMRCERLLADLSNETSIEEVVTDDAVLANLIRGKYVVRCNTNNNVKKNNYREFIRCIKWSVNALLCRSKERKLKLLHSNGATIIDTDIAKKSDKYNDRYYGNVLDKLPSHLTVDYFYNIIYLPSPKRKEIAVIDKNTKYNIIYLWDFLSFSDYFSALRNLFRKDKKSLLDYDYLDINQRPALEATYKDNVAFYFFLAFLYERVIYRMKEAGVKIRLYVDWFENQSFDKSFHWSMTKYYPSVSVHSYIGFMADTKENPITIATNTELDNNIAPKYIFTCNKALKKEYENSGYKGIVELAPFYRADSIWGVRKCKKENNNFTILVPLGLNYAEVCFKTKALIVYMTSLASNKKVSILIKPHPVFNDEIIKSIIGESEGISIVKGNIYDYLPIADAVIASNSTTTYEALALGIPLMYMIDPEFKLTLNRPSLVPDEMWNVINDSDSFNHSIDSIGSLDSTMLMDAGIKMKDYFFTKNTMDLTNKLFNIL